METLAEFAYVLAGLLTLEDGLWLMLAVAIAFSAGVAALYLLGEIES